MKENPYEKFSISHEETTDSDFTRFNAIVTSLKSILDPDYSSKNHVKSLAHKAKVIIEQTSDDSDSQEGSDKDIDEEEAGAFNLLARNFRKGGESLKKKGAYYNCGIEGHFASESRKPKENKAFLGGAWSDSEDDDKHQNDAKCLTAIHSQEVVSKQSSSNNDLNIIDLQKENEELLKFNKDFTKTFEKLLKENQVVKPYKTCDVLTKEVDSLKGHVSKLQDEALNFSKLKESSIALDDMLSNQKLSQDKEGLGFFKNDKTTSVCLKCDLRPDDWIVDSGCTKHITGNRILFTSYKEYDGGYVVFGSNLKGKVIGGGNITHDSITITNVEHVSGLAFHLISVGQLCDDDCIVSFTKVYCDISKNGKLLAKGHRRNDTCKLGDNSKQQICLASVVDNSTPWYRRLGYANMRLDQNLASNELVRNLPKLSFKRHFCDTCSFGVKETMRMEESLNVTFDERLPKPKSSSSVEDDRINESIVQDLNGSSSLQVNVSDEGYPKSLKEARGHLIEQVIGGLNERTLSSKNKQA
ncbi:retrotransposon protein [Tanacetum coccineum]